MKDNKYTYGLLLKADETAKTYRVKVFPSYFVIGKAGEIVYTTNGYDEKTTMTSLKTAIDLSGGQADAGAAPATKPTAPIDVKPAGGDPAATDK